MEKLKQEIEEFETQIKSTLEIATKDDSMEQLKNKLEQAKADFNNYSPTKENATLKESFIKYTQFTTIYEYLRDKTTLKILDYVKDEIKKALGILKNARNELHFILKNNLYYYKSNEIESIKLIDEKIFKMILQLCEIGD